MKDPGQFAPILYPIEREILAFRAKEPSLIDLHVLDTVAALARRYGLEEQGKIASAPRLDERGVRLYDRLAAVCEMQLGRAPRDDRPFLSEEHCDLPARVAALRRLKKSIETWNEQLGRQGYLDYISEMVR